MKNIIKLSCMAFLLGVGITSCDLDRYPENSIPLDNSLESLSDAAKWNTGFIASFRARLYGGYVTYQDHQADQLSPSADFGNRGGSIHSWTNFNSSDDEIAGVWSGLYSGLVNPNFFLENYKNIKIEDKEQEEMGVYAANAHFVRAYYYSELALRYSKPFNAASADKDLCVPLILKYDIHEKPQRATTKAIYDQIFKDLDEADKLYANVKTAKLKTQVEGKAQSNTFTRDAVAALKARTYLYMSEWQNAYNEAVKVINTKRYTLINGAKEMEAMWRKDRSKEEIMMMSISRPDELPKIIQYFEADSRKKGKKHFRICKPDWLPTQWMIDLFEDGDLRKAIYFDDTQDAFYNGFVFKGVTIISKFRGNEAYAGTTTDAAWGVLPNSIIAPKAFRVAECYLIAAEAAYKLNDEANAKKYLNALRKSRGLAAVTASGDALFQEIKDERTRELAFEGFRLWDLRRWGMPMQRHDHQKTADGKSDFLTKDYLNLNIPANHPKMIWAIPYRDLQTNPNLKGQQNPGW